MSSPFANAASCRQALEMTAEVFTADKIGSMNGVIQFEMGEPENFTAHVKVSDGATVFAEGPADSAALTIIADSALWLAIMKGEENGQMAFMTGKFKADGDLGLLMQLAGLIS